MPALQRLGLSTKNASGDWVMKDYQLHSLGQYLPMYTDLRRLFPSEERYTERTLSTWISFVFGIGLRTNTREEQQRTRRSQEFERRADEAEIRDLLRSSEVRDENILDDIADLLNP